MKTHNHVQLIGYLGADPVTYKLPDGKPVARLLVATDTFRKNTSGDLSKTATEWHVVKVWGDDVAKLTNYLIKGSHVMVNGQLRSGWYVNKKGIETPFTEIWSGVVVDLDR